MEFPRNDLSWLAAFVDALEQGMAVVDGEGQVIHVNLALRDLLEFACSPQEFRGQRVEEFLRPFALINGNRVQGKFHPFSEGGKEKGGLVIFTLESMITRGNGASEAAPPQAEEKERLVSETICGICHDINNPVAILSGKARVAALEVERSGAADVQKLCKELDAITAAAERVSRLVRSLRTFVKIEHGAARDGVDFRGHLEENLLVCAKCLRDACLGVKVVVEVPAGFRFACNPSLFSQTFVSLLRGMKDQLKGNGTGAWDASGGGQVEIIARIQGEYLEMTIAGTAGNVDTAGQPGAQDSLEQGEFAICADALHRARTLFSGMMKTQGGTLSFDAGHRQMKAVARFPLVPPQGERLPRSA